MKKRRINPGNYARRQWLSAWLAVQAVQVPPQRKARIPRRLRLRPVQRQERKRTAVRRRKRQAVPRMRSS